MIKDGFISPDMTAKGEYYPIMEVYENEDDPQNPHLELAALDLENNLAIAEFCSKWGLLGIHRRDLVFKELDRPPLNRRTYSEVVVDDEEDQGLLPKLGVSHWWEYRLLLVKHQESESLECFKKKAEKFQRMIRIKGAVFPKIDPEKVADLGGDASRLITELKGFLDHELENQLQLRTRLYSSADGSGILEDYSYYEFQDLFTGLVLMLKLDLRKGRYTRRCEKHDCNKWFNTAKEKQRFCGPDHQESAKWLRKYNENRAKINQGRRERYSRKNSETEESK